jgi:hypothetical protein
VFAKIIAAAADYEQSGRTHLMPRQLAFCLVPRFCRLYGADSDAGPAWTGLGKGPVLAGGVLAGIDIQLGAILLRGRVEAELAAVCH